MKKPFEVGERVAVYENASRWVGSIEADKGTVRGTFLPDGVFWVRCDPSENEGAPNLLAANAKQCRRLVKKKRRRVWIPQHCIDERYDVMRVYQVRPAEISREPWEKPKDDGPLIEFVEVRKR